jgi:carbon storage regulator
MHVFTRKVNERIMIGDDVIVAVIAISPTRVRLTVDAPKGLAVVREEVYVKNQDDPRRPPP